MYRLTTTDGLDQHIPTAPAALDALDAHLRDQLVGADTPVHIEWTITQPDGAEVHGCAGTAGNDPKTEANLNALHHGLVEDSAMALYEASRAPQTGR